MHQAFDKAEVRWRRGTGTNRHAAADTVPMSELLTCGTVHEPRNRRTSAGWRTDDGCLGAPQTELGSGALAFGTGLWRTTIGEPTAEGRAARHGGGARFRGRVEVVRRLPIGQAAGTFRGVQQRFEKRRLLRFALCICGGPNVEHERRAMAGAASYGTSARWPG